jgi:large subunit ribosomal protein L23
MKDLYGIIRRPLLTEKSLLGSEVGQYAFEVTVDATKADVRRAVQDIFNVRVTHVTTSVYRGKTRRVGRREGKRRNWKKATVSLAEGQMIDFFQGA